jgi:enoyl-CoA hydratase
MIERTERDGVSILRLCHGKASAMDVELLNAIADAFDDLREGKARSVVLTGSGSIFSAGVDLFRVLDGGVEYIERFLPALDRGFRAVFTAEMPVIAAVNGHAIAGGCVLAAACDHRVMARDRGAIGIPELPVGVPFPTLALEIMRSTLPPDQFEEAVFTGTNHPPEEALARGFVNELADADAVLDRACDVARHMAAIPPRSFSLTKRAMRQPFLDRVSAAADADVAAAWKSPEIQAAIRAYVEKTIPKNRGG